MKAAYITETGDAADIQFGEVSDPQLDPDEVLIRVHAASVNPIDTYVRSGVVDFKLPDRFQPGCDAAGVVEAVGPDVAKSSVPFSVGDRVWCTNQGLLGRQGTFAQLISVKSDWCFSIPDEVNFEDAAANALVGVTAHLGLFREAQIQPGETILVIGGTGGVGSMVIQMAKAIGARVITTAGSEAKGEKAIELGADYVINYQNDSIRDLVTTICPKGVNVFWETRREPDFDLAIDLMAPKGRMILMAGRDARPVFPVGPFYVKECSIHGFVMFKATPVEMRAAADEMNVWMSAGKLKSNIGLCLPLSQAAQAHQVQESAKLPDGSDLCGKVVVTVDDD